MHRSVATLCCEICGRPYHPGERIELVRQDEAASVVHVGCKHRALFSESGPDPLHDPSSDMSAARTLIESTDWL